MDFWQPADIFHVIHTATSRRFSSLNEFDTFPELILVGSKGELHTAALWSSNFSAIMCFTGQDTDLGAGHDIFWLREIRYIGCYIMHTGYTVKTVAVSHQRQYWRQSDSTPVPASKEESAGGSGCRTVIGKAWPEGSLSGMGKGRVLASQTQKECGESVLPRVPMWGTEEGSAGVVGPVDRTLRWPS